jgi:hypothetical protein
MSIIADLRIKRRAQLEKLRTARASLANKADNALAVILMKADTLADIATLNTTAIKSAAVDLYDYVAALKEIDLQIAEINEELNG